MASGLQLAYFDMEEATQIFVDRLRDGTVEKIAVELPHIEETSGSLKVWGEAYLAGDNLVLKLSMETEVLSACRICNREVRQQLQVSDLYHVEALEDIWKARFDFGPVVREAILLELPAFVECEGSCPRRGELPKEKREGFHPFENL